MPASPIRSKPNTALDPFSPAFERLQSYFKGDILLPTDTDYIHAAAPWIGDGDATAAGPSAVLYPRDEFDVVAAVRFATGEDLSLARHGAGGEVAVDLSRYSRKIRVEEGHGWVVVDAYAEWWTVVQEMAARGWLSEDGAEAKPDEDGLARTPMIGALDKLERISATLIGGTVVLADGNIVRCSNEDHPDLLSAIKAGLAHHLCIVTSLTLRPLFFDSFANGAAADGATEGSGPSADLVQPVSLKTMKKQYDPEGVFSREIASAKCEAETGETTGADAIEIVPA